MSDFIPEDITTMVMGPRTEAVNNLALTISFRHSMKMLALNQCT